MASGKECNEGAKRLPSDYGTRAALALDELLPHGNRDKAVQRLFDVSLRMAKYLRVGKHWTIERLNQASRVIDGFDVLVASPERLSMLRMEMDELDKRLARLECERQAENARVGVALSIVEGAGRRPGQSTEDCGTVRPSAAKPNPITRI